MKRLIWLLIIFVPMLCGNAVYVWPDMSEEICLASVVAHEARSEPLQAQRAVMDTVLYRMAQTGSSCRSVALARKQFSGFSATKIDRKWLTLYFQCVKVPPVCEGCSHFVREDKHPSWTRNMLYKGKFGKHRFYYENKEK